MYEMSLLLPKLLLFSITGRGISGLLTGKLFDSVSGLGERWTFRFFSLMALFVLVAYVIFNIVISRKTSESLGKDTTETLTSKSGIQ